MAFFLDLTPSENTTSFEPDVYLGQGTHAVTLTKLSYIPAKAKVLAVFSNAKGEVYKDWLSETSSGSRLRTKMFYLHMMALSGVKATTSPNTAAELDAFGKQLVAAMPALNLTLVPDEYQGTIRFVLASKLFHECITLANPSLGATGTDDLDVPF